ncbi:response regulator transcription factor [Clostridium gasigenes]|uniref:Stage 0 sporulation protein A homolog n=1 Tax=Clostridium gasigenes TaxID=94869 RepID=A0A1H0S3P0_9CLOT|nr:response regulator transcription factor [Clostridium gasigenes]MBB6622711.1 response regulator transcription factor [Clostridium gasigenes]MBU3089530.1 response regulator transcription factor [Clostridium gasigenes]NKF06294.1 response regulator transcription factor [Clostridium gasigenes]QSW20180.1 response regulator transcription factor [Clostridium gasigenes]SDP36383.1 DNA-binding response regulator, OmpR family, contains REC and winged-helix (wHTH) domain [Clostridium gasigenes]
MNILIADDEAQMVKILSAYFNKEGFNTILAKDGEEALNLFSSSKIDLAILDWMMPKVNGIDVCRYIKDNSNTKVLILTAKGENEDELEALNCGADEYVKKPFDPRILIMRAKKLLEFKDLLKISNLNIDIASKKVYKNEELLTLTKIEFELIKCFTINKGIILSREKLLDLVWGLEYEGDYRTVDTHIRRLRSKIGEEIIKTHRGLGYSLDGDFN